MTLWTDLNSDSLALTWLKSYCRPTVVKEPDQAGLALITGPASMPEMERFRVGTEELPEGKK